jgi:hypothetical protein
MVHEIAVQALSIVLQYWMIPRQNSSVMFDENSLPQLRTLLIDHKLTRLMEIHSNSPQFNHETVRSELVLKYESSLGFIDESYFEELRTEFRSLINPQDSLPLPVDVADLVSVPLQFVFDC